MNVILTGSSSGIGRTLARHLLGQGHHLLGLARSDQTDLQKEFPAHFRFSRCDVADWKQIEAAAREAAGAWTHADGLVTCAGVQGELGAAMTANPAQWSATVRANLDGTYYSLRAFHGLLTRAPRRAKVICLSGGGATKARANFSAYGAAKTAIVRLVETVAEELRGQPIDLNAIAPGAINTRMTEEVLALGPGVVGEAEYQSAVKQKAAGGASLDKAVGLVDWLLSPRSDGISGRLLAAPWDPWSTLGRHGADLAGSDVYQLRRILPEERKLKFE